jgi:O-antigen ligase
MILFLIVAVYPMISIKGKFKIGLASLFLAVLGVVIFTISIAQTGGLILNRYQGEDALGREKASKFSGREQLAESELTMFIENPIWGIGVGKNKEYREELIGVEAASHNEITRMLAEHGAFGILGLLILFSMPFVFYFTWNRKYLFMIPFFLFWLLTINHAAMRTAAPAFMYALTLLKFDFTSKNNEDENETTLPREQA